MAEDVEVEDCVLVVVAVEAIGVAAAAARPVRLKRDRRRISNNQAHYCTLYKSECLEAKTRRSMDKKRDSEQKFTKLMGDG